MINDEMRRDSPTLMRCGRVSVSRDTVIACVTRPRILCDWELAGCVARSVENIAGRQ